MALDRLANLMSPPVSWRPGAWAACALRRSVCLAALALMPWQAALAARLALVIGNDLYQQVVPLKNARNDARLMARLLADAGFELVGGVRENLTRVELTRAVNQFRARISARDEVVVYFAGHGVQTSRGQMLLPVDVDPESEDQVESDALRLDELQDKFREASFTLLVIDACRDNPFPPRPGRTRAIGAARGLERPTEAPAGTAVLLAASRNQRALDYVPGATQAGNGLFTYELVQALRTRGMDAIRAVKQAQVLVEDKARRVGHAQRPALVDETRGEFVMFPGQSTDVPPPRPAAPAPVSLEDESWALCRGSATAAPCQAYLADYPQGRYARLARTRADDLSRPAPGGRPVEAPTPRPGTEAAGGDLAALTSAIEDGFMAWSSGWSMDRYQRGSVRITEQDCQAASSWQAVGSFRFSRFGAVHTIPFTAALRRSSHGQVAVDRLCYADNTSGMRDCVNLSGR